MSKSLIISLVSMVIGLITIAVGLYVLSVTPAPAPDPKTGEATDPFVIIPQVKPSQGQAPVSDSAAQDVPSVAPEQGSEPWCEQMMLAPDNRWTDQDTRLFAKNCVYE